MSLGLLAHRRLALSLLPAREHDYAARWLTAVGMILVAGAGLTWCGVRFDFASIEGLAVLTVLMAAVPVYTAIRGLPTTARRTFASIHDAFLSMPQLLVVKFVCFPLTYLAARAGSSLPIFDATLRRLDAALFGFDWLRTAEWIDARPRLEHVLWTAYYSIDLQTVAVVLLGSIRRPGERNGELIWLAIVSSSLTTLISAAIPAYGMTGELDPIYRTVLSSIRGGEWTDFSFFHATGIISFPSFHTTVALLLTYLAGRVNSLLLIVFLPLNVFVLLAVCPIGGHYLVDAIAGAAVALVSIGVVRTGRAPRHREPAIALA